jgi:hypothetical protein
MNRCTGCHAELSPHNVVRLCVECKHVERDRRAGFTADEVSNLDEARTNFAAVFAGLWRQQSTDVLYGDTCRCGRFRARRDTNRCEWCTGPRRFKRKRAAA